MRQSTEAAQKSGNAAQTPRIKPKPERKNANGSEMMYVRVPDRLKKDATKTLEQIGMTLPDALRLFMHRVVVEQALPFRPDVPNAITHAALEASMKPRTSRFSTPQEMFDALEEADER